MNHLPTLIRDFRMLRGLTQQQFGNLMHKAPNTIANWEKGVSSPDVNIIVDMCDILKITPNELFGWEKSDELELFLSEQKENIKKMDELVKQRSELDARIRAYQEIIGRRKTQ